MGHVLNHPSERAAFIARCRDNGKTPDEQAALEKAERRRAERYKLVETSGINIAAAISFSPHKTRLPGGVVSTILDVGGFYETAWIGDVVDDFADEERFDDEADALAYHEKLVRVRRGDTPRVLPPTPTKPSPTSPPYAS